MSGTDVDVALPWVNTVVHQVMPIAVIVEWVIDPPRRRIALAASLSWLVYPLLWTGYTLVRGALVGWYPYPFLDPESGYATVGAYVVAILAFGIVLCAVTASVGNALGQRRANEAPAT